MAAAEGSVPSLTLVALVECVGMPFILKMHGFNFYYNIKSRKRMRNKD